MNGYTWWIVRHFVTKGDNFCDFLFAFLHSYPFKKGSPLIEMKLLPLIVFFLYAYTATKEISFLLKKTTFKVGAKTILTVSYLESVSIS